ncbi:hypothetical protein FF125_08665 [Aureibaculum algae]|uniref:DUF4919 domain-containing protein n=1 Tax=Aureibaculum algae TaxID=2584122 RepID=A0A5B7TQJ3_9FLAO|nr:hypothetical protein [Aureibaculum algae]QCX38498.1 hypothetical protein FF125_08665 [Aureibaculum algae]
MKRTLLSILTFLVFTYAAVSQTTDYSKVIFSSKIYEYKNDEPRTQELGIDKELLSSIIDNLGDSLYSEKEKKDIVDKAWLAFSNPKLFDFVFKDFAVKTINNWGQVNAKGELVLEPNPYLTEWTINSDEFPYFQLALSKILSHYELITYGDDAEGVKSSFNELLITKNINFQDPKDDDWAYSYLETVNADLAPKGLVALVTKGYYNIIVCKLEKKDEITELFKKIEWDFIQP